MIQLSIDQGGERFEARQRLEPPSVYLDHWALRTASRDPDLGERLTRAIEARAGTFVLSWANIGEFCNVNQATAEEAESFLEGNLPRLFFSRFNPFDVIEAERLVYAGQSTEPPHADMKLLGMMMTELRSAGIAPYTCRGMLTDVSGESSESMRQMMEAFVQTTLALRERYLNDREFKALVERSHRSPEFRGTAIVLRELIAGLMRNRHLPLEPNDAMDFAHAVVPVAYCDYVLLDGVWRDQVDRLRTRLRRLKIDFPLAQVFSGRDALKQLIDALTDVSPGGSQPIEA